MPSFLGPRALAALAALLSLAPARALVPEADQGVEFQFKGGRLPHFRWRAQRSALQRLAPTVDPTIHLVSVDGTREAWAGDRVVLGLHPGVPLPADALAELGLAVDRQPAEQVWILQAGDPWAAARAAQHLATQPGVDVATPVLRRKAALHGPFAPRPNDPYFTEQWHLENRDSIGTSLGPDTNPRAAWALTRGAGITIAICDAGFETNHPDLRLAAAGAPHFDFTRNLATAPAYAPHATCVAGLAGATGDNDLGVAGVAPAATLASFTIFDAFENVANEEGLMDMYQYRSNVVQVQNHSWGNSGSGVYAPSLLESTGISNAVTHGRGGLGVVIVRSGGNYRDESSDVNDDGSANDPRVISVAAVRRDGRVASYSNVGACLLVGALSGDEEDTFAPTEPLFTTDQVGSRGYNFGTSAASRPDYAFGDSGFSGTSAAAPQISGLVALILAANPALTARDVQQVLLHSARHFDLADPDLHRNGAGYRVSHNQGFGIPDAGQAVHLALHWSNRPPLVTVSLVTNLQLNVPDDGLHVVVTGSNGTTRSLRSRSGLGLHPDDPTPSWPLVDVGLATNEIRVDLHDQAALIQRGGGFFRDKLELAARAGARLAVFYNNVGSDELMSPGGIDFSPIPALLVSASDGQSLVNRLKGGEIVQAAFQLDAVNQSFLVTNTLACEHVGLRVRSTFTRRGDLRITLISPAGTRSVLQRRNLDTEAGPQDWTYWSVHHFYEGSAGTWTATFADEDSGTLGAITQLELVLQGVAITDTDHDGLDDDWERHWFGSLEAGPTGDPDQDGSDNAREQALGTDPTHDDAALRLDLATYEPEHFLRLTWPAQENREYRLLSGASAADAPTEIARVPGAFPEAEWIVPLDLASNRFYQLQALPR